MATTTEISSVLKDLIQINTDRYNGCMKSIEDVQDTDLKDLFRRMGQQSLNFKNELETFATSSEHVDTDETSVASKLHRAWIDVKSVFTGKDRHAILSAAEQGEDAILKSYREALEKGTEIPSDVLQVVQRQKDELQQSHNMVKALRDSKMN